MNFFFFKATLKCRVETAYWCICVKTFILKSYEIDKNKVDTNFTHLGSACLESSDLSDR